MRVGGGGGGNLRNTDKLEGRPKWRDVIQISIKETGWYELDCSDSGEIQVMGCCEHGKHLPGFLQYVEFLD
jgi:hypothetical protein